MQLWHRIADGRITAVLGEFPLPSDPTRAPDLVVINCNAAEPYGAIREAAQRLERLLNSAHTNGWVVLGSNTQRKARDIGQNGCTDPASFIELLERFALATRRVTALVFRHVERADVDTLSFLRMLILQAPLPLSIVIAYSTLSRSGNARDLLNAVEMMEGKAALFLGERAQPPTQELQKV